MGIFFVVILGVRMLGHDRREPILHPIIDLTFGAVAGFALGAPVLLPGFQLSSLSVRRLKHAVPLGQQVVPVHDLVHLLFQGFDGLPIAGSYWFGDGLLYLGSAAYVGAAALALAIAGAALHRRRPEVIALIAVVVTMGAVAFAKPLVSVMDATPDAGGILWYRSLLPMSFALAVLAGVGMDLLVRKSADRAVLGWTGSGFAVLGVVLVASWSFGRGHLPRAEAAIRARSFLWPSVETVIGLALVGALIVLARRRRQPEGSDTRRQLRAGRWVGAILLVSETAILVAAGAPLFTSSTTFYAPTPAVTALQREVGSSLVGLGSPACFLPPTLGIDAEANAAYEVHELAFYDPLGPVSYFSSWTALTGQSAGYPAFSVYCPGVTSASLARLYGVGFVLERTGSPGPQGAVFDTRVGDEDLYRIPGAAAATLTSLPTSRRLPGLDAPGTPVAVTYPDPSSWKLVTKASSPQVLRLRLTDVPGWHASIDGRPLALKRFAGVMLQAEVPAGTHTVELHYWPSTFSVGIVLASCSAGALCIASIIGVFRRRKHRPGPFVHERKEAPGSV